MTAARRDPRQARFLTWASLRWVVRHRAWTPWYLVRYWRFFTWRLRNRHIVTEGFVFLGKGVELYARKGYGRMVVGRWVHLGSGNSLRCHEGNLRIGDKCVFGKDNTVNAFLDIEFGARTIVADWVYVCDFDHVYADIHVPIKDQGIVKSPVRIGPDCWLGAKVTVLRGVVVGAGSVLAAHALVNRDLPPMSVAGGVPARVLKDRVAMYEVDAARRAALEDIARKTARAAAGTSAYADVVGRLRAAGCVFAEDEARLLLEAADGDTARLSEMVAQRAGGLPLEPIVGWAEFAGLRVAVVPGVFVPRRRTELVAAQAVELAAPGSVVVDLCCGCGAVGAAVLAGRPDVTVHAADVDPVAVACASGNVPGPRGHVHVGDLFGALPADLRGRVGLIACNAPYVPSGSIALMPPEARLHEPAVALDGGADGLDVHRRVAAGAAGWLGAGGHLVLETSVGQAPQTLAIVAAQGFQARVVHADGLDATVVVGTLDRAGSVPAG